MAQSKDLSQDPQQQRLIRRMFTGLVLVMLMSSMNQNIISPSLRTIVGDLSGVDHMSWVITAFILVSTIMMPIYGKVSDMFGRKPFLYLAILAFAAGSVLGALAPNMTTLILARALQGFGGGGLMILPQSIIADRIPARQRGKYMGIIGGVFAFSSVAGPLLGGWITEGPGWRWSFWLNVPLAALALLATYFFIPGSVARAKVGKQRIDYLGMAVLAAATSLLVMLTIWGGNFFAWLSWPSFALLASVLLLALLLLFIEARAAEPVLPLMLFKDRNFNMTILASLALGIAMFGAIGYMPTYFQMVLEVSPTAAGLLMTPMMAALLISSTLVGAVVSKTGRYKPFILLGTGLVCLALGLMSTLKLGAPTWLICLYLALLGVGLGMSLQFLTLVVQNSFSPAIVGTATAANNYFRQVGSTVGSSLIGGLFTGRLTGFLQERLSAQPSSGAAGQLDASSLTPAGLQGLAEPVRQLVVAAYHDALIPLFLGLAPLAGLSLILLCFIQEKPLATSVVRDDTVTLTGALPTVGQDLAGPAETEQNLHRSSRP